MFHIINKESYPRETRTPQDDNRNPAKHKRGNMARTFRKSLITESRHHLEIYTRDAQGALRPDAGQNVFDQTSDRCNRFQYMELFGGMLTNRKATKKFYKRNRNRSERRALKEELGQIMEFYEEQEWDWQMEAKESYYLDEYRNWEKTSYFTPDDEDRHWEDLEPSWYWDDEDFSHPGMSVHDYEDIQEQRMADDHQVEDHDYNLVIGRMCFCPECKFRRASYWLMHDESGAL